RAVQLGAPQHPIYTRHLPRRAFAHSAAHARTPGGRLRRHDDPWGILAEVKPRGDESMEKGPKSTKSRRRFIKGAAVTVAGASAAIAGSNISRAQRDTQSVQQSVRQSELQSNMLRAQSADTRIGRGIASGLLDEVVAGAEDFEKHMHATAKLKIVQLEKQ